MARPRWDLCGELKDAVFEPSVVVSSASPPGGGRGASPIDDAGIVGARDRAMSITVIAAALRAWSADDQDRKRVD